MLGAYLQGARLKYVRALVPPIIHSYVSPHQKSEAWR